MAKAKLVPKIKRKRKRWHKIYAPKLYNEVQLGVSYVYDSSELMQKRVKVSLLNLMNNIRKQNISLTFEIDKVHEGNGYTKAVGYTVSHSQIRRFVRQGRTKVEDSLIFRTKDNIRIRIKPIIITNSKCPKSISQKIRRLTKEYLSGQFKKINAAELFNMLVKGELQKEAKDILNKLFPIKFVEIKTAIVEPGRKDRRAKAETETVGPAEEVKDLNEKESKEKEDSEKTEEAKEEVETEGKTEKKEKEKKEAKSKKTSSIKEDKE